MTVATVAAAALNIILNYIFFRRFGYIAPGYTTLVCYLVHAALDYVVMRKIVDDKVYNMKYIGALSLGVIAVSLLSNAIYDLAPVRYAVLAGYLFCALFSEGRSLGC